MAGTDQLHTQNNDGKLAVLIDRVDTTNETLRQYGATMNQLTAGITRLELALSTGIVELRAASERNRSGLDDLRKQQERDKQSAIERDKQQVTMIDKETAEREESAKDRRRAHDADIAGLREDMAKIKDKMSDLLTTNRIILFLAAAIVLSIIGGIVSGHLSLNVLP